MSKSMPGRVANGRAGGSAAKGAKKSRKMKGVKVGRGSAGRAAPAARKPEPAFEPGSYYEDVKRACTEWLRARGHRVGGFREVIRREARESMEGGS